MAEPSSDPPLHGTPALPDYSAADAEIEKLSDLDKEKLAQEIFNTAVPPMANTDLGSYTNAEGYEYQEDLLTDQTLGGTHQVGQNIGAFNLPQQHPHVLLPPRSPGMSPSTFAVPQKPSYQFDQTLESPHQSSSMTGPTPEGLGLTAGLALGEPSGTWLGSESTRPHTGSFGAVLGTEDMSDAAVGAHLDPLGGPMTTSYQGDMPASDARLAYGSSPRGPLPTVLGFAPAVSGAESINFGQNKSTAAPVGFLGPSILNKPRQKNGEAENVLQAKSARLEEQGNVLAASGREKLFVDQDEDGSSVEDENEGSGSDTDGDALKPPPKKRAKTQNKETKKAKDGTSKKKPGPKNASKGSRKGRGAKNQHLKVTGIDSLINGNVFEDAVGAETAAAQPGFDAGNIRDIAVDQLMKNVPESAISVARADKKHLKDALKTYKQQSIKPRDGGVWWLKGLKSHLRPHQVIGTAFMIQRERDDEGPSGGILADQMGLGKTVMTLALVVAGRPLARSEGYTTLIVATAALVNQWQKEIELHCESDRSMRAGIGRYKIYRSSGAKIAMSSDPMRDLMENDIVLTTYEEVVKSFPRREPPASLVDSEAIRDWWTDHYQQNKGALHRARFYRIVLDESHLMRNPECQKAQACQALVAKHYWCLTGSPCVNGPFDLWSPLRFIKHPDVLPLSYCEFQDRFCRHDNRKYLAKKHLSKIAALDIFGSNDGKSKGKDDHGTPANNENWNIHDGSPEASITKILAKCLLRRTHASRMFDARLVTLPKTRQHTLKVNFNEVEAKIYNIVAAR